MKILVLDNYDSFTYNIVHAMRQLGYGDIDVRRNDEIPLEEVARYDKIALSPGPGIPDEAGVLKALVKTYAPAKSIFGICLGQQAIGEVFGAKLENMQLCRHGVQSAVTVEDETEILFKGLPKTFDAGRYHSWTVSEDGFPADLRPTARCAGGMIMALSHRFYDVRGVQFHPESVLTPLGARIISNWLNS